MLSLSSFYEIIGQISVIALSAIIGLLLLSLLLGLILIKKNRLFLPGILVFTIDTFYLHFKRIARMLGISQKVVDQIGIEVRNSINMERFSRVNPNERILVVPQCLRHPKCPALLDNEVGVACKECGLCIIKDIKQESERLGYRFFIVPGGTFAARVVKMAKPLAALGIACHRDLNMSMHELSRSKLPIMGIPLLKDGCIHTEVDLKDVIKTLKLGIEETVEEVKISPCESKSVN